MPTNADWSESPRISAWWDQVITPVSLRFESADPARYRQAKQFREYFTGSTSSQRKSEATPLLVIPEVPPVTGLEKKPEEKKLKLGKGCS
jgi:hypothetical protein